jgi:tetrahydromethanopterin S-methyltransferase subunit G
MKWSIFIGNILIHVGLMALFLTIFFFTIAQYFEKKIIEDQIDFVIDDFVGNSLNPLSNEKKNDLKKKIDNAFDNEDFTNADESVKKQNQKISNRAWIFVGVLLGIIIFLVTILGFIYKWESYYLKFLFNSSLISLIFVAITETLFMFLIAQNYLSADPNKIKLKIVDTLAQNTCNPCDSTVSKNECIGYDNSNCH